MKKTFVSILVIVGVFGLSCSEGGKSAMQRKMEETAKLKEKHDKVKDEKIKSRYDKGSGLEGEKKLPEIIEAVKAGDNAKVEKMLGAGTSVNTADEQGKNLLMYAVDSGKQDLVRMLIEKGADVNAKRADGSTALFSALRKKQKDTVALLAEKGADFKVVDNFGRTTLMAAAQGGDVEMVKDVLKREIDINMQDKYGKTALVFALKAENRDVARFLIDQNIEVNTEEKSRKTPLFYAVEKGFGDIVDVLIKKKVPVLVEEIIKYKEFEVDPKTKEEVEVEKERKEMVTAYDNKRINLLMYAAKGGYVEIMKALVKNGAKIEETDGKFLRNPLFYVVDQPKGDEKKEKRLAATAAYLIDMGKEKIEKFVAVPWKKDKEGKPVEEKKMVQKISIDEFDYEGWTPFTLASFHGHLDVIKVLVDKGVLIDKKDRKNGLTALLYARGHKHKDVEAYLKKLGAKEGIKHNAEEEAQKKGLKN